MADPSAMRAGLEYNIRNTLPNFRAYSELPDSPEPPCVVFWPGNPFIIRESMKKGHCSFHWVATVIVAIADAEHGQQFLDPYLATSGAQSIWTALESDATLAAGGSTASSESTWVEQCRSYAGTYTIGTVRYVAAEFDVHTVATG